MKKISLKNLPIDSKEMLTKEQLKNVFGGLLPGTSGCGDMCNTDADCPAGTDLVCRWWTPGGLPDSKGCRRCITF